MLKINTNMQWVIPLTAATWAVWTWAADRERERRKEHARISALYVNPFLSACEDLQSRIYNILDSGGLRSLRRRYSGERKPCSSAPMQLKPADGEESSPTMSA